MFSGVTVVPVAPGTEITGPGGQKMIVQSNEAVFKRNKVYCTHEIYEALKKKLNDETQS